jgi:hypothetical protein
MNGTKHRDKNDRGSLRSAVKLKLHYPKHPVTNILLTRGQFFPIVQELLKPDVGEWMLQ